MHGVRSTDPAADLRIQLQERCSRSGTHRLIADVGNSRAGLRISLFFDRLRGPKLVIEDALRRAPPPPSFRMLLFASHVENSRPLEASGGLWRPLGASVGFLRLGSFLVLLEEAGGSQ